jgi:uncharacterized protein YjbI with pentapeptide repeats
MCIRVTALICRNLYNVTTVVQVMLGIIARQENLRYMADQSQVAILRKGTKAWTLWAYEHPHTRRDLSGAQLAYTQLSGVRLYRENHSHANLSRAMLGNANLSGAHLSYADLSRADLWRAYVDGTNLYRADLSDPNLRGSVLLGTTFTEATLTGCNVYGISAWNLNL